MRPNLHSDGHLTDEQIVTLLHSTPSAGEASHLAECARCRSELEAYQTTLDYVSHWQAPERGPEYGRCVWERVAGRIGPRKRFQWLSTPAAVWAAVAASGVVLLLVPAIRQKPQEPAPAAMAEARARTDGRRLLHAALGDHLERASILFTHVLNDSRFVSGADDDDQLQDLIAENRLYRQTAEQQNDRETAALLSDVEAVLLDLQHSSAAPTAELRYVQQRISNSNLRFRLGVARSYQQPAAQQPAARTHVRLVGRGL